MKINMAWLYAITKYGYPPPIGDVFKALEDAKRLGFKAIELEVYKEKNLDEIEKCKREIRDQLNSLGLKVVNFAAIFPEIVSINERIREKGLKFLKRAAELAIYFESPMLQTDTFTPPLKFVGEAPYTGAIVYGRRYRVSVDPLFSWKNFWETFVDTIKRGVKIAGDYGLFFTIEPRVGETISNTDAMLRLLEAVNENNFGAVLDCGHLHAQKELLPLSIEKLGKKIMYVHISDNDGRDNLHLAPGKGTIDWDGVFEALKKHKFNGYFAIDVGGNEVKDHLDNETLQAKKFLERMGKKYAID